MSVFTEVYLLQTPLDKDYKNTLYFGSSSDQHAYFSSKIGKSYTDFSYQRKDSFIRIPDKFDNIMGFNYVMYKNPDLDKWFYCFITDIKYIDEGRTDVYIQTDCVQTWLFDYEIKPSFVEREHVKIDNVGEHTVPEKLETGPYYCREKIVYKGLAGQGAPATTGYMIVVASTVNLTPKSDGVYDFKKLYGRKYDNVYSGVSYFGYTDYTQVNKMLVALANSTDTTTDAIHSIFLAPSYFYPFTGNGEIIAGSNGATSKLWSKSIAYDDISNQTAIHKPSSLGGYVPKNKKLLTYPFCYLLMSNNNGSSAVYKYEHFRNLNVSSEVDDICDFTINVAITPGCSIRLIPRYYNGATDNNEEGLNGGKFPICSWNTDVYTNWLTQNAVNIGMSAFSGVANGALSVASNPTPLGVLGGAVSTVSSIGAIMGQNYAQSMIPPQVEGNINSGDITFSTNNTTFTAYQMTIKNEYAEMIDNYFSAYGYQINRIKVPHVNHRKNFWFTKTLDANIVSKSGVFIPLSDLETIKKCYDSGITFWRNNANFGDLTVDNPIT